MLNITKIQNAGQAHAYYSEKDDYHLQDKAAATWGGAGAERLGLRGEINAQDLKAVLEGKAGAQQVGKPGFRHVRQGDGTMKKVPNHMPGLDLTFSASKSYSIAALARGDKRLIDAHDRAVKKAMDFVEKHGAVTRQRNGDGGIESRETGNLTYGAVRHATNREGEPQMHTHVVVANMTFDPESGAFRSIDSRRWRDLMREADTIYQSEMGRTAVACGYNVDWSVNRDGFVSGELAEVSQAERVALSTRRKQIDDALAQRGKSRKSSSRAERDTAALDTRAPKDHMSDADRKQQWLNKLAEVTGTRNYDLPDSRTVDSNEKAAAVAAERAVQDAMAHLSERSARFTERELVHETLVAGDGKAGPDDAKRAIAAARKNGDLIDAPKQQRGASGDLAEGPGLTTKAGRQTERDMLDSAAQIASRRAPLTLPGKEIDARIAAQEKASGYEFTAEQREATKRILGSGSSLGIVQGYAGTSKTSSVMSAVANAARERGMRVRAIAPTHSAADTLGRAVGAESATVAAINSRPLDRDGRKEAWLVDEAGMVSAKDMRDLLAKAERANAQVVLTGDIKQIDSVGAGRAFGQLQAQHRELTYGLTDIKRQQNEELRQAVYDTLRGNFSGALGKVDTKEIAGRDEAINAVGDDYMRHTGADKDTIVVTLSRQDRDAVNAAIQQRREAAGHVTEARTIATLRPKQLTGAEQADASRYRAGDVIEAHRDMKRGPKKGELTTVTGVEGGRVVARDRHGNDWSFDPGHTTKISVHQRGEYRIGVGDKIVARASFSASIEAGDGGDKTERIAIKNNTQMTVESVSDRQIAARMEDGRRVAIDTSSGAKIDLAYAQTANQAQGRTADVAIAYMRSTQTNLADRQHAYVAMSRAREHATIVTDSRAKLADTLDKSARGKETAMGGHEKPIDERRSVRDLAKKFVDDTARNIVESRREAKHAEHVSEQSKKRGLDLRDGRSSRNEKSTRDLAKRDAEFLRRGARERADEIRDRASAAGKRVRKTYGINVDMGIAGELLGSKQTSRGHARLRQIRQQRDEALTQLASAVERAHERQAHRAAHASAEAQPSGEQNKRRGLSLG